MAHRLAWFYMTGEWPADEVDHKNLDGNDNRWCNLRAATTSQNQANKGRCKTNPSGFKGVTWSKSVGKWWAQITVEGKRIHLGFFTDINDAAQAYKKAAEEHFGEFARVQ